MIANIPVIGFSFDIPYEDFEEGADPSVVYLHTANGDIEARVTEIDGQPVGDVNAADLPNIDELDYFDPESDDDEFSDYNQEPETVIVAIA